MGVKVKLELDADADRLAQTIQKAVSKGFQGVGSSGLATDPSSVINAMMGNQSRAGAPAPSDYFLRQGAQSLAAMGPLFKALPTPNGAPPDWFLKQGQERALSMGELFPKKQNPFASALGKAGISTSAAALESAAAGLALGAVVGTVIVGFKALKDAIGQTISAYDSARKLYAQSLISGLGIGFTANRKNLADVLGVSEKEVFQFGAAVASLGPRLKFANDIMTHTTPTLTAVAYEFEIAKLNANALFMSIANDVAPALHKFANGLATLFEVLEANRKSVERWLKLAGYLAFSPLTSGISGKAAREISKLGTDSGPVPSPQGLMKQLPVSAFEKMGLVIGGFGGTTDYARRTANATEKMAKLMNASYSKGGAPRTFQFFNPDTSNP